MQGFPIDLATVNWAVVSVLAALVFVAALIGGLLSFRSRLIGAILTTVLFVLAYVFINYYPHGLTFFPPGLKPA